MDEKQDPGSITLPDSEIQETGREPLDEERAPSTTIPVVAIGASAGGLEVVRRLLAELHPATGFAFVFVQHLDPSHHSLLSEILSRATTIPVHEAADGMPLVPNHVFVIPEKVDLTVSSGLLKLTPRTQTPGPYMPIDRFLRSVAEQCGNRAIGIILSGTGTDGSAGMEAIKAAGGVTFAQDAASARFPAMPQAAIATGCVDFVLPPERIAAELARIAHHPYLESGAPAPPEFTPDDELSFSEILKTLCASTNIDFSLYREKMIKRRILRRLALGNIDTLAEYSKRLVSEPAELAALHQDLLISVTSFFRDRESFAVLKTLVFPALLRGRQSNDALRLWVAGCATGEEAYSIAISLLEYLTDTGISLPIQIFASDLSLAAIEKARAGHYLENIEADVSPERLNRYFTRIESGYQVNKNLREMCVFTKHNLIDDPPFSKLDLISCRNVLIYLGNVRNDIISLFHYALKPTGYLLLGASEGPAADDLFSTVNAEHRLFVRKDSTRKSQLFQTPSRSARRSAAAPFGADLWDGGNVRKEVDRILLSKYSPSGVVVDADLEVLEIRGKANAYLTLPAGKVSFNLIKLIPDTGLFLAVEKLIAQVRQTGEIAHLDGVRYDHDGISRTLNLQAMPLDSTKKHSTLVLFEPAAADDAPPSGGPAQPAEIDPKTRQITLLKQQLAEAKERFCASVEAHQTSREEIQNTTEEALSANEELQSLNEELETAKEELQSTNEELITVNEELHAKNAALAQARDFAMSIVETVGQP
ncbi:MAG: signal transduction histidine kinase, partial [Candidatus Solibacter sp.]|nr:signal transduction histidine kinase [Candidatus Solibacter sp.]